MSEERDCKLLCPNPDTRIKQEFITRNTTKHFCQDNRRDGLNSNLVASEHKSGILLLHHSARNHHRNIALQSF
jgi:hypothetical protein